MRNSTQIINLHFILLITAQFLLSGSNFSIASETQPNIIYILADDLGYGDIGCYSQQQIQTPHIDRLASEGMRFTQHYSGSTVCAPSRACLMTGLHTGHVRIRGNKEVKPMGQHPLADEDITIAEILHQAGYTTALIGKWGLGYPGSSGTPNKQGFDYFFGYLGQRHAHNYYPEFLFRNEERIKLKGNKIAEPRPDGAGVATERAVYSHDLFVEEAINFIEENQSRPFFLMLTLTIPHANNEAGENGMEVPDFGMYQDKKWPDAQKGHAAMISRMDHDIGKIVAKIKTLAIDEKTIVMFSSDNGPHSEGGADPEFFNSNGPLRGIKRDLYEGGIRVPLIVCWPGAIKQGMVSDHISAFWDMMPTFAELASVDAPENTDGISMVPALLGKQEQKQHKYLYWEFPVQGGKQAMRMGPWKAVRLNVSENHDAPIELYNLDNDIGETTNVADKNPDLITEFKTLFYEARIESDIFKLFN